MVNLFRKENKNKFLITGMFVLFIFVCCLWNLGDMNRVRIIDDEFGYWGIAATLSGYDWTDMLSVTEYYSFGYSFILIPLFWLNRIGISMEMLYKVAIVMNALMMSGTFLVIQYCVKKIFHNLPDMLIIISSFFTTIYIGNVTRTNAAWCETYLLFIFWCLIAVLIKYLENPKLWTGIVVELLAVNLLAIHMRTIGAVFASGVVMGLYMLLNLKKLRKRDVVAWIITFFVFAFGFLIMKNYVTGDIYSSIGQSTNDVSAQIARTKRLISVGGMIDLFLSIMAKIYYVTSAGFLFPLIGLVGTGIYLAQGVIHYFRKEKRISSLQWLSLLVFGTFIGETLVTAVFDCLKYYSTGNANIRLDTIIYGRYMDFAIGPVILVGIWMTYHLATHYKTIMMSAIVYVFTALLTQHQFNIMLFFKEESSLGIRGTASPWFEILYNGRLANFAYYAAAISIVVYLIICFLICCKKWEKTGLQACLLMIGLWWGIYNIGYTQTFINSKIVKEKTVVTVQEILKTDIEAPIYVAYDKNPAASVDMKILQWLLGQRSLKFMDVNDLKQIDMQEAFILCDSKDTELCEVLGKETEFLYDSGTITVFVEQDHNNYEKIMEKAVEMNAVMDPTISQINLADVVTEFSYVKPNGSLYYKYNAANGAYLTEGMGVTLEEGVYEFIVDIRAKGFPEGEDIGYITTGDMQGNEQDVRILNAVDFSNGDRQKISVQVEVKEGIEPMVGIYTYENVAMRIYGIAYKKEKEE